MSISICQCYHESMVPSRIHSMISCPCVDVSVSVKVIPDLIPCVYVDESVCHYVKVHRSMNKRPIRRVNVNARFKNVYLPMYVSVTFYILKSESANVTMTIHIYRLHVNLSMYWYPYPCPCVHISQSCRWQLFFRCAPGLPRLENGTYTWVEHCYRHALRPYVQTRLLTGPARIRKFDL